MILFNLRFLKNQRQSKLTGSKVTLKQETYKPATNEILQPDKITNESGQ